MKIRSIITIFFVMAFTLPLFANEAEKEYADASKCYQDVIGSDAVKAKREPWRRCITKFEAIASQYDRLPDGAKAQYSVGRLYQELATISHNNEDLNRAVAAYKAFARKYPNSPLADDAYFNIGRIEWEHMRDKKGAKKAMVTITKYYKTSDMAPYADKYLDAINSGHIPTDADGIPVGDPLPVKKK